MYIISKYRDYYDSVAKRFQDSGIKFIRTEREITDPDEKDKWVELKGLPRKFEGYGRKSFIELRPFAIGFCGKIYRGARTAERPKNAIDYIYTYWYDFTQLNEHIESNYKFKHNPLFADRRGDHRIDYKKFFELSAVSKSFRDRCIEEKITIITHFSDSEWKRDFGLWLVNNPLKDVQFWKMFNPFLAYQELMMWVGGVLNQPERPMVTVSDKVKIHKHGFDKHSFRKLPTKK